MLYIVRTRQIKDDNFKPLEQPNNVYLAMEYDGSIGLAYFTKIFQNAKTFISPEQAKTFIRYTNLKDKRYDLSSLEICEVNFVPVEVVKYE